MEKQEDIYLPEFKKREIDIFDSQFPARLKEAEIYDPTKFTILTGDDGVLDDLFSYQVYNKIKNHWRAAAAPADKQPGMIRSDSDDDKLHHYGAAAWEEILQVTRSLDVSPQFATVRLMDTGGGQYLDVKCNENLGAHRLLNIIVNDAARTIDLGGNLTLGGALNTASGFTTQNNGVTINAVGAPRSITLSGSPTLDDWFDQGVKQANSPIFATVKLSALTDGYVPYHVSDAAGLADSPIWTDGTSVGIGNPAPQAFLHIGGTTPITPEALCVRSDLADNYIAYFEQDAATGWGVLIDLDSIDAGDPAFVVKCAATNVFVVSCDGNISMGSATSIFTGGTKLNLEAGATGIWSNTINDDETAVTANVSITLDHLRRTTSGKKYKKNIVDLELDSSLIYNLRPVSFNSITRSDDKNRRFIGLIADEVEQIFPEIVHHDKNNEPDSYDNQMLMTLMLAEIQKHQIEIETLKVQLNN